MSLSVSKSQPRPTVELFGRTGQSEVSNQLRLHRADLEERRAEEEEVANNNNTRRQQEQGENLCKESRARRRRRVRSCYDEGEVEDAKEEENLLAGEEVTVTKKVDCCQDCGASLPSEWHRPPNRHDCQAMSETVCQVGLSLSLFSSLILSQP